MITSKDVAIRVKNNIALFGNVNEIYGTIERIDISKEKISNSNGTKIIGRRISTRIVRVYKILNKDDIPKDAKIYSDDIVYIVNSRNFSGDRAPINHIKINKSYKWDSHGKTFEGNTDHLYEVGFFPYPNYLLIDLYSKSDVVDISKNDSTDETTKDITTYTFHDQVTITDDTPSIYILTLFVANSNPIIKISTVIPKTSDICDIDLNRKSYIYNNTIDRPLQNITKKSIVEKTLFNSDYVDVTSYKDNIKDLINNIGIETMKDSYTQYNENLGITYKFSNMPTNKKSKAAIHTMLIYRDIPFIKIDAEYTDTEALYYNDIYFGAGSEVEENSNAYEGAFPKDIARFCDSIFTRLIENHYIDEEDYCKENIKVYECKSEFVNINKEEYKVCRIDLKDASVANESKIQLISGSIIVFIPEHKCPYAYIDISKSNALYSTKLYALYDGRSTETFDDFVFTSLTTCKTGINGTYVVNTEFRSAKLKFNTTNYYNYMDNATQLTRMTYDGPELNIDIDYDEQGNPIVRKFKSAVYNIVTDDFVYIRSVYGSQKAISIKYNPDTNDGSQQERTFRKIVPKSMRSIK